MALAGYTNFLMVIATLAAGFALWWTNEEPTPKLTLKDRAEQSYDYVIVGGGSAGCVVATRLSEDPATKVLLLEAGDDGTDFKLRVPFYGPTLPNGTHDWHYASVKQHKACLALKGQICTWPRGKTLGGSGSINGMVYVRGSRHDYDEWAARGATGWSFKDVLPYFLKSENMAEKEFRDSPYHGNTGPMNVTIKKETLIADYIYQAGAELKLSVGEDYNDMTNMEGIHYTQMHTVNGKRTSSTAMEYLWPVMGRKNLHVVVNAHVTKVLFQGKTAIGVEYTGNDSVSHQVTARKEVILSSGAIGTPQLLLLSGVGPKKHLQDMGIPLVADLPVGENLKDHIAMMVPQITINQSLSVTEDSIFSYANQFRYKMWKTGPRANAYNIDNLIWFRSEYAKRIGMKTPDVEILIMSILFKASFRNVYDVTDEVLHEYFDKSGLHGISPLMSINRPESSGYIRLRSKNPFDKPLIDPNYLDRIEDVERLIEGIKYLEKLINTEAMQKLGAKFLDYTVPFPTCRDHKVGTDAYWTCLVRQGGWAFQHAISSCRMGAKNDPGAVVDPQLRVRGLDNLRIVDASVMPSAVSGNTNAPTIMIAEKGSDLIRGIQSIKKI